MDKTTRPKHIRHFNHPEAEVIWAAVMTLDDAARHEVYEHLADHLVVGLGRVRRHDERRKASVAALREANEILGHSPSVRDYRNLVEEHPEYGWPKDSAIRRWLGNASWNDALAEAGLARVADGDFVGATAGYQLELDELIRALKLCADETGFSMPPQSIYLGWAARRTTQLNHDRIPKSLSPYNRFGGYFAVAREAGMLAEGGAISYPDGTIRPAKFGYSDEDMLDALREVAQRLGHSPLTRQYRAERDAIRRESARAGALRSLPAWGVIRTRFGTWDEALIAAGLEPTNGRVSVVRLDYKRGGRRFTDADLHYWMRRAFAELGSPARTSALKQKAWRLKLLSDAEAQGEYLRIPTYEPYRARWGTWEAAKRATLDAPDPTTTEAPSEEENGGDA